MESSRSEEKALRRSLEDLQQQRSRNSAGLLVLHDTLREREHGLCVQVSDVCICIVHLYS